MQNSYNSWGRIFHFKHDVICPLDSSDKAFRFLSKDKKFLPFGLGRSYGDSCLNNHHSLIETKNLDQLFSLNLKEGTADCGAGMSLDKLLNIIVPKGFFLPVTPGTKFVTIGGAIANDVHGKNHHQFGSFGHHVKKIELLRSTGRYTCSQHENSDLFRATIGGLGLTGLVTRAELSLVKKGPWLNTETIKFNTLPEFYELTEESDANFEFTVAWIDSLSNRHGDLRGHFIRANWSRMDSRPKMGHSAPAYNLTRQVPRGVLNPFTLKAFNALYYHQQLFKIQKNSVHYDKFFYPLDKLGHWNLLYGKRGFYQYQFVIPETAKAALEKIFQSIKKSGLVSFLSILKKFGKFPPPGLLSFPIPGITLALDFPNTGKPLLELFNSLDKIVKDAGGRIYPAKDSRQSGSFFRHCYRPHLEKFSASVDPKFSSSFWRRVTQDSSEEKTSLVP